MRRTRLQGLTVLHKGLYSERIFSTRETFVLTLMAYDHGKRHPLGGELLIDAYHLLGLRQSLFPRGMSRVPLLPQKLGRAKKQAGTHLPAHHVGPLITENRQIAIRVNPVLICVPDDSLRGGAHYELLFEPGIRVDNDPLTVGIVLETIVGNHSALFGETLHMVRLLAEKRFGYEQREIGVFVPRLLEHLIESGLHLLPNSITVRLDNHTSAYGRIFRKARFNYQIIIPL